MSTTKKLSEITKKQIAEKGVQALANRPNAPAQYGVSGLSPAQLKLWFDKLATFLAEKINELQKTISSDEAAEYIRVVLDDYNVENLGDLVKSFLDGTFAENILQVSPDAGDDMKLSLQSVLNNILQALSYDREEIEKIWSNCGATMTATLDTSTYILTIKLFNKAGAVLSTHSINMMVNTERIADLCVTTEKLANKSVTNEKLGDEAVTGDKIASELKQLITNSFNSVKYDVDTRKLTFSTENGREQIVDLPLELITSGGYYDDTEGSESVVLVLANQQEIRIPVGKLLSDRIGKIGIVQEMGYDERKVMSQKATTEAINNASALCANALKGSKSGSAVVVTDVSPVEHTIDCKVDTEIKPQSDPVPEYMVNWFLDHSGSEESDIRWYSGIAEGSQLKIVVPDFWVHYMRIYAGGNDAYLDVAFHSDYYKFTAPKGDFAIVCYTRPELGVNIPDQFTLCFDLSEVNAKVRRYGKNLCDIGTQNFTTVYTHDLKPPIPAGYSCVISAVVSSTSSSESCLVGFYHKYADGKLSAATNTNIQLTKGNERTGGGFTTIQELNCIYLYAASGSPQNAGHSATFKDVQIAINTNNAGIYDYEPFVVPTEHAVTADGTVEGITSVYPSVTLFADKAGVNLDVTYNRDINKAFAELQNAIISTGGNV